MKSYLIQDTTREERDENCGEPSAAWRRRGDGCAPGVAEMYQAYIDGEKDAARDQSRICRALCFRP